MMRYKRHEGFRFTFDTPLPASFTIEEINGRPVETSEGTATIMDISPNGLKLNASLNIPISTPNQVKISVRFQLDSKHQIYGMIIWREEKFNHYLYGIHLINDTQEQEELIRDLKSYVKSLAEKV